MAATKYQEYKAKIRSWKKLFEQEYGRPPTSEDCHASATWTALNEKSKHYEKQLPDGYVDASFTRRHTGNSHGRNDNGHHSTPPARSSSASQQREPAT